MNDFRELYKNYTTAELLNIIRVENEYQPEAVQAARMILEERNVTEAEIAEELKQEETAQEENEQSTDELLIKRTAKSVFLSLFNPFIPSETDEEKNKNIIAIFCILTGLVWLRSMPTNAYTLYMMFTENSSQLMRELDSHLISILPFISAVLLYKRYKVGWYLFVLDFVFALVSSVVLYVVRSSISTDITGEFNFWRMIYNVYDTLFNISLCFGILAILCSKSIRNMYDIEAAAMKNCLIVSILISVLFLSITLTYF